MRVLGCYSNTVPRFHNWIAFSTNSFYLKFRPGDEGRKKGKGSRNEHSLIFILLLFDLVTSLSCFPFCMSWSQRCDKHVDWLFWWLHQSGFAFSDNCGRDGEKGRDPFDWIYTAVVLLLCGQRRCDGCENVPSAKQTLYTLLYFTLISL